MISSRAASCPACGAVVKRANYAGVVIVLGIVILFVIAVMMGMNQENSPSAAQNPVKAQVGLTASAVVITNLDQQAWPTVTVYLNGTPLDGYNAVYNREIAPHQRILIPFSEFVRGDRRFNPIERKVQKVMCTSPVTTRRYSHFSESPDVSPRLMHIYEIRPRKDKRGFDLISDALPFGRLWYGKPNAASNAIGYATFFSRPPKRNDPCLR